MGFTPTHQPLTTETAVPTYDDLHLRPDLADLCHYPLQFHVGSLSCISVRGLELGGQQVLVAEYVQRQVTVAVVESMKEPPLLLAM